MKTIINRLAGLFLAAGLIATVSAKPPYKGLVTGKTYERAGSVEEIQGMKKGDRYAKVCMECKSVTIKELENEADAEALCHNGGKLHCDSCEKEVTVKRIGPPGRGVKIPEVTYVNAEGEECMFIVPLKDQG